MVITVEIHNQSFLFNFYSHLNIIHINFVRRISSSNNSNNKSGKNSNKMNQITLTG